VARDDVPQTGADGDDTDEDLAGRFSAGDGKAFELLVRRYRDALYRFVRWHLGATRSDAEDVTQDILIEVHRSLGGYEGRSRFRTWMFGLARNVCLRRRRAAKETLCEAAGEKSLRELPDAAVDLETALERREVQETVRCAIEELGPGHRDVVLLREIEGLSYEEIAAVLEVPIGTVRSRLHNARAALAERLAPLARGREEER
jgi:RNA polymerase sigma-70 factor, ECF subfamily